MAGSPPPLQAARRVVGVALRAHSLSACELAAMKRHMQMQDAVSYPALATGSPESSGMPTNYALLRNGDEADARMEEIQQILGHAAMHLLDRYALVAEWVRHAEAKAAVFDQIVAKPKGGRPEGGIRRAARGELPIPGKTVKGRYKYIERAIKIDGIWEEAKSAARTAGLGNIQCCLLSIAHEHSLKPSSRKCGRLQPAGHGQRRDASPLSRPRSGEWELAPLRRARMPWGVPNWD